MVTQKMEIITLISICFFHYYKELLKDTTVFDRKNQNLLKQSEKNYELFGLTRKIH